ncbi:MAG TPA: hypothetical protein VMW22_01175, partial [Candidatus Desulfaltia sp.]|nr:hypothetical protein [Candidatus Desulfaltia sp.]
NLKNEDNLLRIYEIFDIIARESYQPGRLHYISFWGAERYYQLGGVQKDLEQELKNRYPGTNIEENIKN